MNTRPRSSLFVVVLASAVVPVVVAAPKIDETVVGPAGAGGLYVISQNDAHVAYVGAKGTRTVVAVDGVEGPVLDELFNGGAANIAAGGPILLHNAKKLKALNAQRAKKGLAPLDELPARLERCRTERFET